MRVGVGLTAALIFGMAGHGAEGASRSTPKTAACPTSGTRVVSFARSVDGGGFLTSEGEEVRLAGILASGAGDGLASANARDTLVDSLRDRTVTLAAADAARDRYDRMVAQVFADGTWVQGALLEAGEVRAAPDLASTPCAKALLAAEARARNGRAGQWRSSFRIRDPDDLKNVVGSYQVVEGRVVTASVTRGRAFINFGADYKTDFTVTIDPESMRTFRQARFDVASLAGKRVRVRGWIEFYNGPEITITTPAVVEVLE